MIRCNANLFRIASLCQATDRTRYYLAGVYVEPHHTKGVTLTTTDGHRLLCIHDEDGEATENAIVSLREILRLCKPKNKDCYIGIETGKNAAVLMRGDEPLAMEHRVRVDGTFPDYRNVVPKTFKSDGGVAPIFASVYLASMGEAGMELAAHFTGWSLRDQTSLADGMRVLAIDNASPALVVWPHLPQAFGVLMPVRGPDDKQTGNGLPDWYATPVAKKKAVA